MRTLTKDLGRLVYKVDIEPAPDSNARRVRTGAIPDGVRRAIQTGHPDSLEQHFALVHHSRALSSDEDTDSPEQTTPLQHTSNRTSIMERQGKARLRANSDDNPSQSTSITTNSSSSAMNRVGDFRVAQSEMLNGDSLASFTNDYSKQSSG